MSNVEMLLSETADNGFQEYREETLWSPLVDCQADKNSVKATATC